MAQLTLTRYALQAIPNLNYVGQHTWPLKVVCTAAAGGTMSPKIFVFHSKNTSEATTGDVFEAVASVHQLAGLPENQPTYTAENSTPYYRLSEFTWHCLSPVEADDLWAKVKEDFLDLIENQTALNQLTSGETYAL